MDQRRTTHAFHASCFDCANEQVGKGVTLAICFKCGAKKDGAFGPCSACKASPRLEAELVFSLALCEHLSSPSQLLHHANEIKNHHRLTVPDSVLAQARAALNDPQLMAMLGLKRSQAGSAPSHRLDHQATQTPVRPVDSPPQSDPPHRGLSETTLHRNPFWILGATSRDDRRRIVELAEEKSLTLDHGVCQKARADITNPRARLAAEIAWLPGVSPRRAEQLARLVLRDPMAVRAEKGLPLLAHANLMAAAFEAIDEHHDPDGVAQFIQELADLVDAIVPEDVTRDINEDRAVSGFPEVKSPEPVESELGERKRYYRNAIKDALNRLPTDALVAVMTDTVAAATAGGEAQAPGLIDELVDSYEVETQHFLQKEAENVQKLIKATRESARSGEKAVKPLVDKLEAVTRNWEKIAHPIQLSSKARGILHRPSTELAFSIRSLAIDLFNEHDLLTQSNRITSLLQELFTQIPELAERVEQDAEALQNIFQERKQAEVRRAEWAQEITYRAEVGMVFKDALSISPDGVSWKGQHFPLDAITRVRWGGVRHSVNGIPTGTTFTVAFGDNRSEAVVELKKEEIFSAFVDKLWRAVGVRLLTELLEALRAGRQISFGDAVIRDDGTTLTRHKFLGNEQVRLGWDQLQIWTADGSFVIGAKDDKKTYAQLSYIAVPNVHMLEQAIRMAFKKPGLRVLSDLLKGD